METFLNSLPDSFGCSGRLPAIRVFKNIISSGVQVAYFIFSRAVRNLASSGVCVFCLLFSLRIITVTGLLTENRVQTTQYINEHKQRQWLLSSFMIWNKYGHTREATNENV